MGEQVYATLDDDLYDKVNEEHEQTGRKKSKIINEKVRIGYKRSQPSLADSVFPTFGEGLFVAGWVVASLSTFVVGVVMSLLGLGLFVGAKVDAHMTEYDVSATKALIQVLGA